MATESFGASFGNPRQYMGSSPLGDIWKGLKTGATVYGMEKSGLVKYLDQLGVKQKDGVFSFNSPKSTEVPGAVSQTSQPMGGPLGSGYDPTTGVATYGNQEAQAPIAGAVAPTSIPMGGPLGDSYHPGTGVPLYFDRPQTQPVSQPKLTGQSILDERVEMNPNDYDPRENYGYTQQLASGNEYQNSPGYGSTAKKMSSFFGMA